MGGGFDSIASPAGKSAWSLQGQVGPKVQWTFAVGQASEQGC